MAAKPEKVTEQPWQNLTDANKGEEFHWTENTLVPFTQHNATAPRENRGVGVVGFILFQK